MSPKSRNGPVSGAILFPENPNIPMGFGFGRIFGWSNKSYPPLIQFEVAAPYQTVNHLLSPVPRFLYVQGGCYLGYCDAIVHAVRGGLAQPPKNLQSNLLVLACRRLGGRNTHVQ